jgi:hypothetical protein
MTTGAAPRQLPELDKTKVSLPWDTFRELLEQPLPDAAAPPPFPFTVARADYTVHLLADHARVEAVFQVAVLADTGWVTVRLLRADQVALLAARVDEQEVSLARDGAWLAATLDGRWQAEEAGEAGMVGPGQEAPGAAGPKARRGVRELRVEFLVDLEGADEAARALTFATPRAPITKLLVSGVRRDVICSCRPGYGLETREEEGGVLVAEAALPPTSQVTFSWRPKAERIEPQRPSLLQGEVHTAVAVRERSLQVTASVSLKVTGAPAASVDLSLPPGFSLHTAQGDVVRDARLRDGRLQVRFTYDLLGSGQFTVRGEVPIPADEEGGEVMVEAPVLAIDPSSSRQRGTVGIEADPRVEVAVRRLDGATQVDPSELTTPAGRSERGALLAFKFVRARPTIELGLRRHRDASVLVATCDHAHYRVLLLEEGKLLVKAHLLVRNNARPHLALDLPEGAELWSTFTGGTPARPSGRGRSTLVPLLRQPDQAFEVEVCYLQRGPALGEGGTRSVALPSLDLPVTYTSLELFLPERYRHFNFDGNLRRVESFAQVFRPPADAVSVPVGAWASNVMPTQSMNAPAPLPPASGKGPVGGEGQLPIRIPMLERGQLARFEETLLIDERPQVAWEHKRRRSGGW